MSDLDMCIIWREHDADLDDPTICGRCEQPMTSQPWNPLSEEAIANLADPPARDNG